MRKKCTNQISIFDLFSNHDIGKELKAGALYQEPVGLRQWVLKAG